MLITQNETKAQKSSGNKDQGPKGYQCLDPQLAVYLSLKSHRNIHYTILHNSGGGTIYHHMVLSLIISRRDDSATDEFSKYLLCSFVQSSGEPLIRKEMKPCSLEQL